MMQSKWVDLKGTQEIPTRKIALTKLDGLDQESRRGRVIGWEYSPPRVGRPYVIHYEGMVLRTTRVQGVKKKSKAVILRTLNSVYQLEYLLDDNEE